MLLLTGSAPSIVIWQPHGEVQSSCGPQSPPSNPQHRPTTHGTVDALPPPRPLAHKAQASQAGGRAGTQKIVAT
ncbi:hypothetical protein CMUS01_00734 [Colletotrichum musicola]|uniref:Uncharacterized protein n=1 Tax=Colletotrichum musicola TaxID=2175873 RepID=A0A8H6U9D1_9PEZI|nr:hypothetical protein CMUS01_00734 [Colletotrichum musicola]